MTAEHPEKPRAEYHFQKFMESIGVDPDSEHTSDTPRRVREAYEDELFRGLNEDPKEHLSTTFEEGVTDEFVIVGDIQVQSMCAHHFLPFTGRAWVGYIPRNEVVGLSKLSRVTDGYARRPQVQERLTAQVADAVHQELAAKAVIVHMECEHHCMSLRGVQEPHSSTTTTALRGHAKEREHIKQEFFQSIEK